MFFRVIVCVCVMCALGTSRTYIAVSNDYSFVLWTGVYVYMDMVMLCVCWKCILCVLHEWVCVLCVGSRTGTFATQNMCYHAYVYVLRAVFCICVLFGSVCMCVCEYSSVACGTHTNSQSHFHLTPPSPPTNRLPLLLQPSHRRGAVA